MTARKQVPPGTRDARTGQYIRKPVRVRGAPEPKSGCLPALLLALCGCWQDTRPSTRQRGRG